MGRLRDPARVVSRKRGARFYIGVPCRRGHGEGEGGTKRYTSTNACAACVEAHGRRRPDRRGDPFSALFG